MVIGLAGCALAQDSEPQPAAADYDENEISRLAPSVQACGSGLYCSVSGAAGASFCQNGAQQVFCCPRGYSIAGGSCLPNCGRDLSCSVTPASGTNVCSQSYSNGSQTPGYCCPFGKVYSESGCH